MRIWFDSSQSFLGSIDGQPDRCPSDGSCPTDDMCPNERVPSTSYSDCPTDDLCLMDEPTDFYSTGSVSRNSLIFHLLEEATSSLYSCHFIYARDLYTQKFADTLWLVCNLKSKGKFAVLDVEMYTLLNCFHSPKTLQAAIEAVGDSYDSPLTIARAVALFMCLDFLVDLDKPATTFDQEQSHTLAAWLHVTNACNLRCHYCYVQKTSDAMANDTSKRAIDAVIRSAITYHHKHIHLTYAGGEATLQLPQVFAMHDYALQQTRVHGLSLSASLLSNGVALPPRSIDQLKQYQIQLMISLDGIGEEHDQQRPLINSKASFTLVDRTITRLLAKQLVPYINVTVTQRNLDGLPRLMEYLLQRDLPFGLSYYRENECSAHMADLQFTDIRMIRGMRTAFAYIEQYLPRRPLLGSLIDKASMHAPRQYTCGVGRNYLVIDQRGGIAKCQVDIKQTITTINAENPLKVIRESAQGVQGISIEDKEGCRDCDWRYWCSGGCPMLTYRFTGRSDIRSPNCAIYKTLFPDVLRLEALRLLKYESPISF